MKLKLRYLKNNMKIKVLSRLLLEEFIPQEKCIIISIKDPDICKWPDIQLTDNIRGIFAEENYYKRTS